MTEKEDVLEEKVALIVLLGISSFRLSICGPGVLT
jgi:hypothetical protein